MLINFQNVEQLIFYDKKVQQLLPEWSVLFHKWRLTVKSGVSAKDVLIDFLNGVTAEQLDRLNSYFGLPVSVQKVDISLVNNVTIDINELYDYNFSGYIISMARDDNLIYLCGWRWLIF